MGFTAGTQGRPRCRAVPARLVRRVPRPVLEAEIQDDKAVFYILTVGSQQPRCIVPPMPEGVDFACSCSRVPVLLHHCLHWIYDHNRLVVFDTVVESFRWMRSPIGVHCCHSFRLHEMQGTLAISGITQTGGMELLKIWALTDYEREVWSFMRQILSPKIEWGLSSYTVVSEKANAQFLGSTFQRIFHYSSNKGKWLEEFQQEPCHPWISNHLFKESLICHAFFPMQGYCLGGKPYFLRGLGTVLILDDLVSCSVYLYTVYCTYVAKFNKLHVHRKVVPVS